MEKCFYLEELNNREKYWIKKFDTISPHGYNLLEGGNSKIHSQETRDRISKTRKKQIENGLAPGFTGKRHSEKTRKILSEKSRGNTHAANSFRSKEYREKQRVSHLGKRLSEETKRKISESLKHCKL